MPQKQPPATIATSRGPDGSIGGFAAARGADVADSQPRVHTASTERAESATRVTGGIMTQLRTPRAPVTGRSEARRPSHRAPRIFWLDAGTPSPGDSAQLPGADEISTAWQRCDGEDGLASLCANPECTHESIRSGTGQQLTQRAALARTHWLSEMTMTRSGASLLHRGAPTRSSMRSQQATTYW